MLVEPLNGGDTDLQRARVQDNPNQPHTNDVCAMIRMEPRESKGRAGHGRARGENEGGDVR
eukprot:6225460-Prymnesium_polylepis.1